ncbi:hypothetical protein DL98DRAFT_637296, partial [Cadophora sp. DSE1049]
FVVNSPGFVVADTSRIEYTRSFIFYYFSISIPGTVRTNESAFRISPWLKSAAISKLPKSESRVPINDKIKLTGMQSSQVSAKPYLQVVVTMNSETHTPERMNQSSDNQAKDPDRYRYLCTQCSKRYTRGSDLRAHVRRSHTKERSHKCGECPKDFPTLRDLKRHKLLHKGEMDFVCNGCVVLRNGRLAKWGCGKAFSREDGLVAHLRAEKVENFGSGTKDSCLLRAARLMIEVSLDNCEEFAHVEGSWSCWYRNPWRISAIGNSWTGCGQKFSTQQELYVHFWDSGDRDKESCRSKMRSQLKFDLKQNAAALVRRARQEKTQDWPQLESHSIGMCARVVKSVIPFSFRYRPMKDGSWLAHWVLKIPAGDQPWIPFDITIGNVKITKISSRSTGEAYQVDGPPPDIYLLDFMIPFAPNSLPGADIRLRANLIGDLLSHTYDTVVIDYHQSLNITSTIPATTPSEANVSPPSRQKATYQQVPRLDYDAGLEWPRSDPKPMEQFVETMGGVERVEGCRPSRQKLRCVEVQGIDGTHLRARNLNLASVDPHLSQEEWHGGQEMSSAM